jgi:hypothetical protein
MSEAWLKTGKCIARFGHEAELFVLQIFTAKHQYLSTLLKGFDAGRASTGSYAGRASTALVRSGRIRQKHML